MNRAMWMLGAAAVISCAGAAVGATTKVKDFAAVGVGLTESPDADAMASLKYDDLTGNATFHLVAHDLAPNLTYGVYVETEFGWAFSHASAFTTNSAGNGHWHTEVGGFFEGNYTVVIYVWDSSIGPADRSWLDLTTEEWRVIGTSVP